MSFGASSPTICISTTATSKSLALPICAQARIVNTSTTLIAYVQFGVGSATAVIPTADGAGSACYALHPSSSEIVDVPRGADFVAAIASGAGPTLVYITPGFEKP